METYLAMPWKEIPSALYVFGRCRIWMASSSVRFLKLHTAGESSYYQLPIDNWQLHPLRSWNHHYRPLFLTQQSTHVRTLANWHRTSSCGRGCCGDSSYPGYHSDAKVSKEACLTYEYLRLYWHRRWPVLARKKSQYSTHQACPNTLFTNKFTLQQPCVVRNLLSTKENTLNCARNFHLR